MLVAPNTPGGIIPFRWATSSRYDGRHHSVTVGGIISFWWATSIGISTPKRHRRGRRTASRISNDPDFFVCALCPYRIRVLYEPDRKPGPITEAACWAHARRQLFELADIASKARNQKPTTISPIAFEAVQKFDAIFMLERSING